MSANKSSGGVLLMVFGVWVLAQVLGGKALQRLGLTSSSGEVKDPVTAPDNGFSNVPHDGLGRPL